MSNLSPGEWVNGLLPIIIGIYFYFHFSKRQKKVLGFKAQYLGIFVAIFGLGQLIVPQLNGKNTITSKLVNRQTSVWYIADINAKACRHLPEVDPSMHSLEDVKKKYLCKINNKFSKNEAHRVRLDCKDFSLFLLDDKTKCQVFLEAALRTLDSKSEP
ncbi:MAG: hypothetical protein KDD48_05395 [Bdellovibrionales bacterium]|nr:hypothetical protein [Bdellovibrionales bacterium]